MKGNFEKQLRCMTLATKTSLSEDFFLFPISKVENIPKANFSLQRKLDEPGPLFPLEGKRPFLGTGSHTCLKLFPLNGSHAYQLAL